MAGPNPIYVDFIARGVPEVLKAIQTVTDAIMKSGAAYTQVGKQSQQAAAAGTAFVKRELKAQEQAVQETARRNLSLAQQVARKENQIRLEVLRGVRNAKPSESPQAQLAILRSAKTPDDQKRVLNQVAEIRARAQASNREARDQAKILEEGAKRELALKEQTEAEKAVIARRWQMRVENEEFSRRKQFLTTVTNAGGTAVKNATTVAGTVGKKLFETTTNLGGGFSIDGALQNQVNIERTAAQISNITNQGDGTRVSKKDIQATIRKAAISTGTDEADVAAGLKAYVAKTGKYGTGADNAEFFAKVAKANDTSSAAVMGGAGVFAMQNENMDAATLKRLTLRAVMQSRKGSIEFEDLAKAGGNITRSALEYSGNQADRQSELLGLAQIGMRVAGDNPSAVGTYIANVASDARKHSKDIEGALGHKFLNSKGQIEGGPTQFIADVMRATGGNIQKVQGLGFNKQAIRMFEAAATIFNPAEEEALRKGQSSKDARQAGYQAILDKQKEFSGGDYDEKDLEKDFAEIMQTSAEQFHKAVQELTLSVGDALIPVLKELIPTLKQLTPPLTAFLKLITEVAAMAAQNPFKAFAATVTVFFIKELAAAKIGDTIRSMINTTMGGSGPGGVGPGGLGPQGAAAQPASLASVASGVTVAAGMAAQTAIVSDYVDQVFSASSKGTERGQQLATAVVKGGPEADAAAQELEKARANSTTERQVAGYGDYAMRIATAALNPFAAIGQFASDKAAAGFGKASGMLGYEEFGPGIDKSKEAIQAAATVSSFDKSIVAAAGEAEKINKSLASAAVAAQSISNAVANGVANPENPKRGQSVPKRTGE